MSDYRRCPNTTKAHPLLAAPLAWGVRLTYARSDGDAPDPHAPVWDLSVEELVWLLRLAQDGEAS